MTETLEHGYVAGRFVLAPARPPAAGESYPVLSPASGVVRFSPVVPGQLLGAGHPVTVVQEAVSIALDSDGWVSDVAASDDGPPCVLLPLGVYDVGLNFPRAASAPRFRIQVTAEHTRADPLDLTLESPVVVPPGVVEVVRVADRVLAVAAAAEAAGSAQRAESAAAAAAGSGESAHGSAQAAARSAADAADAWRSQIQFSIDPDNGELGVVAFPALMLSEDQSSITVPIVGSTQ